MGIRVAVVQGDPLVRKTLRNVLSARQGQYTVSSCATRAEAVALFESRRPELIVLDVMSDGSGLELMRTALDMISGCAVLVFTSVDDPKIALAAIRAGASGYLLKPIEPRVLIEAIATLRAGGIPISPRIARVLADAIRRSPFTAELAEEDSARPKETACALSGSPPHEHWHIACPHLCDGKHCPLSGTPCPVALISLNILQNIDIATLVVDSRRRAVIFENSAATEMFKAAHETESMELRQRLLSGLEQRCLAHGHSGPHMVEVGARVYSCSTYQTLQNHCCILLRDVTEKRRLESIAEAANLMDSIGYVFSGIRHEIGNPVNSTKMTLSVLRERLASFTPEVVKTYLERALGEIGRVEYLLRSLKAFNMFEKPNLQAVDLPSFLEMFMNLAGRDVEKQGIRIDMKRGDGVPSVEADPRALQQVMLNLLTNAADAVQGLREPHITLSTQAAGERVTIRIEDNGCGISSDQHQHLFKPFYTSKTHGTGLGLVICRKLLASMGGGLEIESRQHEGTSAIISLPKGGRPVNA